MRIWRLQQSKYDATAFTGEGAKRAGGRFNSKGVAVVYASATLSLAALETVVHADPSFIRVPYSAFAIDVPDDLAVTAFQPPDLPANWRDEQPPQALQALGDQWVKAAQTAVLSVPSVIIPEERNYALNPAHPDFARLLHHAAVPFSFDPRLIKQAPAPTPPPAPVLRLRKRR